MQDHIQEAYKKIVSQELEEGTFKNVLAATAIAGAALGISKINDHSDDSTNTSSQHQTQRIEQSDNTSHSILSKSVKQSLEASAKKKLNLSHEHLTSTIVSKFKVNPEKAAKIASVAMKYSKDTFPQAHHILAIAGIESSFDENAKSALKHDPAVGLMQMRPKVWGVDKKELSTIEGQIKHGAHVLHQYYTKTGSVEGAVKAYNIGLTNYNSGKQHDAAHRYATKFTKEVSRYSQI